MNPILVPCSKHYGARDRRVRPVALAVAHWTASPPRGPGLPDPARVKAWLANAKVQSSTHFVIMRDGSLLQAASLDERTWHAGGSEWTDPAGVEHDHINAESIGFDLENVGPVYMDPGGVGFVDSYHGVYKGAEPVKVGRGLFEPYTPAQLATLDEFVRWLAGQIPALRDPARWVGHQHIMSTKIDPGPLFPWEAVRAAIASL